MKLKLKVDDTTTVAELRLLGALFTGLAGEYAVTTYSTFNPPADEAELSAVDPSPLYNEEHPPEPNIDAHSSGPGFDAPKRRRRTKAELAAAGTAEPGTTIASTTTDPEPEVTPEPSPLPEVSAPTPTAPVTDTAPTEPAPAASEPAAASPSDTKTYTPAEVQKIAVATAGRFGPEKVKAIIAQYPGAARIADLPLGELAGFVAKLNAVS
jgi:hypothetical protein